MLHKIKGSCFRAIAGKDSIPLAKFCDLPIAPIGIQGEITTHMLWVDGELTKLERLSCSSFVKNGYRVRLWTYGDMRDVPPGVELCDAREILPDNRIFRYYNGSYAGFSNLFRYKVLCMKGGLWADLDVVCMLPASELQAKAIDGLIVTEHKMDGLQHRVNNNLIYLPKPKSGDMIDLALAISERYETQKLRWGDCGPRLLTMLARNYPAVIPTLMEPNFANPLSPAACPRKLFKTATQLPKSAGFLHCYNERWRKKGIDKNSPWPESSLLGRLAKRYLPERIY
ncbi:hypothetical protein G6N76_02995 [Rhizobium daejeonense]|uniref:Glycosyl transferase n=1 Tax=Rhizobium daejeonense TaxID=240521 RepID=A0A6M1S058_9HYPH|nr:hypothetical protein [Rhizobium daejeonense]NGO62627.1 hypothetical protein [Rhizobium daejeonense]